MPWPLIRVAGLVVPLWRELATMSYLWRVPHAIDGQRLARRCPALTTTPIDAAMHASLVALGFGAGRNAEAAAAPS